MIKRFSQIYLCSHTLTLFLVLISSPVPSLAEPCTIKIKALFSSTIQSSKRIFKSRVKAFDEVAEDASKKVVLTSSQANGVNFEVSGDLVNYEGSPIEVTDKAIGEVEKHINDLVADSTNSCSIDLCLPFDNFSPDDNFAVKIQGKVIDVVKYQENIVYRGDVRQDSQYYFRKGWKPNGDEVDLDKTQKDSKNSAYISTSKSSKVALLFGGGNGYYVIDNSKRRGIDIPETRTKLVDYLPPTFVREREVAMPGGVPPGDIIGFIDATGTSHNNPFYAGSLRMPEKSR